jgi:hypothetical protein
MGDEERQGRGWGVRLAMLAGALLLIAGVALVVHVLQGRVAMRRDAQTLADMRFAPDNTPLFPRGAAERGPLSRLVVDSAQATLAEQRAFAVRAGALNMAALTSPYLLAQQPGILKRCPAITTLNADAARLFAARGERLTRLARAIAAYPAPEAARAGMQAALAPDDSPNSLADLEAAGAELRDSIAGLCRLLARGSWFNDHYRFGFRNAADTAAYKAALVRRDAAAAAQSRLERQARARAEAGQEPLRDWLASSTLF